MTWQARGPPQFGRALCAMSGKGDGSNFRQRRLSVSDIDTSEFNAAAQKGAGTPQPQERPRRRMSLSPEMGVQLKKLELPFKPEVVGTYSCHGVEPGRRQGETSAKINQDRGCQVYPFGEKTEGFEQALFCVYDGHGAQGDKVSHFVVNTLADKLAKRLDEGADVRNALTKAFVETDAALKTDSIDAELSGTTAVVMLYRYYPDTKKSTAWLAWVGDSRAVLARKVGNGYEAQDLTTDHKPDSPDEMKRINKCGGFVSPPEEEWGGTQKRLLD